MTNTENTAKRPASSTGFLATLSNLFRAKETSAPSHTRTRISALALAVASLALLALAPSALATPRVHDSTIPTSAAPSAMAVNDSNGDIYVIDVNDGTLARYDSTGAAKAFTCGTCSGNTLSGFVFPGAGGAQVAIDSTSGRIYVTNISEVDVFDQTGAQIATLNGASTVGGANGDGLYATVCGVGVDQSNGNVYVGDINDFTNGVIWRYTPSGGAIAEADYSGAISAPTPLCNVAAAQGSVYSADSFSAADVYAFADSDFSAAGAPALAPATLIDSGATAIYADSHSANLYADKGGQIDVSDNTGAPLYSFGSGDFGSSSGVAVMPSPTGKAYVADAAAGEIDVYAVPPPRDHVSTIPTSAAPSAMAVNDSNGDIYVIDVNDGTLARYDSTGAAKAFTCGTCSGNTLSGFWLPRRRRRPGRGRLNQRAHLRHQHLRGRRLRSNRRPDRHPKRRLHRRRGQRRRLLRHRLRRRGGPIKRQRLRRRHQRLHQRRDLALHPLRRLDRRGRLLRLDQRPDAPLQRRRRPGQRLFGRQLLRRRRLCLRRFGLLRRRRPGIGPGDPDRLRRHGDLCRLPQHQPLRRQGRPNRRLRQHRRSPLQLRLRRLRLILGRRGDAQPDRQGLRRRRRRGGDRRLRRAAPPRSRLHHPHLSRPLGDGGKRLKRRHLRHRRKRRHPRSL